MRSIAGREALPFKKPSDLRFRFREAKGRLEPRVSTTLDNGSEHVKHAELRDEFGMQTYFADSYRACQRDTNEFHNGLIRRYLPKGTDFAQLTQEELDDIIWEINNRPRKVLNYNTPQEVFDPYL